MGLVEHQPTPAPEQRSSSRIRGSHRRRAAIHKGDSKSWSQNGSQAASQSAASTAWTSERESAKSADIIGGTGGLNGEPGVEGGDLEAARGVEGGVVAASEANASPFFEESSAARRSAKSALRAVVLGCSGRQKGPWHRRPLQKSTSIWASLSSRGVRPSWSAVSGFAPLFSSSCTIAGSQSRRAARQSGGSTPCSQKGSHAASGSASSTALTCSTESA
mmetsp:Transcript_10134/g.24327  ORF Transcript_10134/g.24327 Transcript_10134/m.24327 type:complete len:219 (-) Transcript_10134:642-1298(-)